MYGSIARARLRREGELFLERLILFGGTQMAGYPLQQMMSSSCHREWALPAVAHMRGKPAWIQIFASRTSRRLVS